MMPAGVFVALIALLAFAIPAGASKTHLFKETFGSVAQPSFGNAGGMAVDQSSGDVLVIDASAETVSRYNPDGTAADFSGLGTNVIDGKGNGECATVPADCDQTPQNGFPGFGGANEMQVAVDNSGTATDGNVYVTQVGAHLLDIFSSEGKYLGQLTESSAGAFGEICGVTVDSAGALYVGDFSSKIHKFVPAANPPVKADNTTSFSTFFNPCTLAAGAGPTAGFIFATAYNDLVVKLDSSTGEFKYVVSSGNNTTVSVDPLTGHVYAAKGSEIIEFDASGAGSASTVGSFALASGARGVAVRGSTDNVYVTRSGAAEAEVFGPLVTVPGVTTGSASAIDKTTATLNGTVNPDGVALSECKFEYGTTTGYGQSVPCAESLGSIGSGASAVPVHADVSGLVEGTEHHFRLVAKNANGTTSANDETFVTLSQPVIAAEWAEGVVLSEATLKAEINPKGFTTTYKLEWGTTASYGSSTAASNVGSDNANHKVSNALSGLEPDTTYHYRFVAVNSIGTANGPDHTFTTYEPASPDTDCPNQVFRAGTAALLPDCRAYEMVSPVEKNGSDIVPPAGEGTAAATDQSSLDGSKITYSAVKAFGDALSAPYASQYIATRHAGEGWTTHSINPPSKGGPPGIGDPGPEYKAFSPDLATGWLRPESGLPLAPGGIEGQWHLYKRDIAAGTYRTLNLNELSAATRVVEFQGNSADGDHAVFRTAQKLTPEAPANGLTKVYEWNDGQLRLVSRLPDGEPYPTTASDNDTLAGTVGATGVFNGRTTSMRHAISDDGRRVFWSAYHIGVQEALYVRENADQEQSAVSAGECTEPAKACTFLIAKKSPSDQGPIFWDARPDGSKALYTLDDLNQGVAKLYEFDVGTKASTLIASKVKGVVGASADLSSVYFVSMEALDSGAIADEPNLYLYRGGTMRFIATLDPEDVRPAVDEGGVTSRSPVDHFAAATADGSHIVFVSRRSLTGYDNTDSGLGAVVGEVFRYDAESDELSCVSCNPSGARPAGSTNYPKGGGFMYKHMTAAWIQPPRSAFYQTRLLSGDGNRVFFNSFDALVPRDSNGVQDVYAWEAPGTGGCEEGDPSFSTQNDGCISLLSSGESPDASQFVDATPSGEDAFIRTSSGFVPQDPGLVDIYDARVGGGLPQPGEPTPCVGDACQSAPEPPNDATPASAGFRGAGDPAPRRTRRSCRARNRHAGEAKRQAKSKHTKRCRRNNRRAGR